MKGIQLTMVGTLVCIALAGLFPMGSNADPTWEAKHLYIGDVLTFELGTRDQGTIIEYGVKVTTPDQSVVLTFMDSTNYAAFSGSYDETFVGQGTQIQVRTREATFEIPYQQQWYFVAISDDYNYEIDIEYYVVVQDDTSSFDEVCCGGFFIGFIALLGAVFIVFYVRK